MSYRAKISIIIPTYNEDRFLSRLLKSIRLQSFTDFEIIVSDSSSNDSTLNIARKYGAKVIIGPKKGPGFARNIGARIAEGEILLFLDADVIVDDKNTLRTINRVMARNAIVGGTSQFYSYDGKKLQKIFYDIGSEILRINFKLKNYVMAPGWFIFVNKKVFEKSDGFQTDLPFCEDHNLIKKIGKFGKLYLLKKKIGTSSRRFHRSGIKGFVKEYFIPTFFYFVNRDYFKKKFKFYPASILGKSFKE